MTKEGLKKENVVMRIGSLFLHAEGEESNKRRSITVGKFSGDNVCALYLLHYIIHQTSSRKTNDLTNAFCVEQSQDFNLNFMLLVYNRIP